MYSSTFLIECYDAKSYMHLCPFTSVHPDASLYLENAVSSVGSVLHLQRAAHSFLVESCSEYINVTV